MTCGVFLILATTLLGVNTAALEDLVCAPGNNAITATARFTNMTFDEIIQPNYPDGHGIMKCVWTLNAVDATHRIKIAIKTLSLAHEKDRLSFYDGANMNEDSRIGIFGPCAKGTLVLYSTGPSMTVVLVSNGNAARGKLKILFKALPQDWISCDVKDPKSDSCSSELNDIKNLTGHLTSPNFPSNFSSEKMCLWRFNVPEDHRMKITFEWMGIHKQKDRKCALENTIKLSDMDNSYEYCGCNDLPVMDSTRNIWMKLLAAPRQYWSGFLATYRIVPLEDCPIGRTDCSGDHESHGFNKMGQLCSDIDIVPTTPPPTTISTPPTTTSTPPTSKRRIDDPQGRRIDDPQGQEKEDNLTDSSKNGVMQKISPDNGKSGGGSDDERFTVECDKDYMLVTVSLERFEAQFRLVPSSLRLEDSSCKPYFLNDTLAIFRVPLEGCGTYHNSTMQSITYWNTIHGHNEETSHHLITRRNNIRLGFDCSYAKRRTLSVVSYSPRKKVVYSAADGRGNFTFLMDMYKSDQYRESFDRYPVPVVLNQRLYLQVVVKSKAELVIFPQKCMATPSSDPGDAIRYDFIDKGCPLDDTLIFNYQLAPVQQFSVAAFRFINITDNDIYIHCLVQVCIKSDNGSVCSQGCSEGRNSSDSGSRKRRSLSEHAQEEELEFLTLGPLKVQNQGSGFPSQKGLLSKDLMTGIVAGVLGLCIIVLTVAIVVIIIRKARRLKTEVYFQIKQPNN